MTINLVYECEDDIVSCLVEDILVFCIYNAPASSAYRCSITKWEFNNKMGDDIILQEMLSSLAMLILLLLIGVHRTQLITG